MLTFLAGSSLLVVIVVGGGIFVLHFLPVFVAGSRHVRNFWWILLVNVLFGWTLIGWVAALVWALRDEPEFARPYYAPPRRPQF